MAPASKGALLNIHYYYYIVNYNKHKNIFFLQSIDLPLAINTPPDGAHYLFLRSAKHTLSAFTINQISISDRYKSLHLAGHFKLYPIINDKIMISRADIMIVITGFVSLLVCLIRQPEVTCIRSDVAQNRLYRRLNRDRCL